MLATKEPSKPEAFAAEMPTSLAIGTRILMDDSCEGRITARDERGRVFLESPVYTGWLDEASFLKDLRPHDD